MYVILKDSGETDGSINASGDGSGGSASDGGNDATNGNTISQKS